MHYARGARKRNRRPIASRPGIETGVSYLLASNNKKTCPNHFFSASLMQTRSDLEDRTGQVAYTPIRMETHLSVCYAY